VGENPAGSNKAMDPMKTVAKASDGSHEIFRLASVVRIKSRIRTRVMNSAQADKSL
jgi:hypothetical protein